MRFRRSADVVHMAERTNPRTEPGQGRCRNAADTRIRMPPSRSSFDIAVRDGRTIRIPLARLYLVSYDPHHPRCNEEVRRCLLSLSFRDARAPVPSVSGAREQSPCPSPPPSSHSSTAASIASPFLLHAHRPRTLEDDGDALDHHRCDAHA